AVFAVGGGALVGVVCASAARLIPANQDVTPAVVGSVLFGAGIGYATDVSPFMVCALAGLVAVNASPRRRDVRAALRASQLPINYFLMYSGQAESTDAGVAVLTTLVLGVVLAQFAAPPLMRLAVRAGPAPLTPAPARPELTTNAPAD